MTVFWSFPPQRSTFGCDVLRGVAVGVHLDRPARRVADRDGAEAQPLKAARSSRDRHGPGRLGHDAGDPCSSLRVERRRRLLLLLEGSRKRRLAGVSSAASSDAR